MTSIPVGNLVRLRHNPFFDYVLERLGDQIIELTADQAAALPAVAALEEPRT